LKFAEVHSRVANIPFISKKNARFLYELIIDEKMSHVLELGIAHGVATCIIAAALDELGHGKVTAVDLLSAEFKPSPEELLARGGLSQYAEVVRMKTGYNWFLHNKIAERSINGVCQPLYQLCIIDGPKNWTIDGAAFFMADKLLLDGGVMIFDDYNWTYAAADKVREITGDIHHSSLAAEEAETPHIREVFDLLVRQHPSYGEFTIIDQGSWVTARKRAAAIKSITYRTNHTLRELASLAIKRPLKFARRRAAR
jgi:predicted O-methyltransferase YrrM